VSLVLDAGALVAIDRLDRRVWASLRVAREEDTSVRTSGGVIAQVWRSGSRQANLARALAGVDVAALDHYTGRRVGELLARSKTADVVDGHVALLANPGDTVLTSDVADLRHLLRVRGIDAAVQHV
jgi:hypothetical protein